MARYCVYCYNGNHNIYYRKSEDYILTSKRRKCAKCGEIKHLVIVRLFPHFDYQGAVIYRRDIVNFRLLYSELFFYLPLRTIRRIYRYIKKRRLKKNEAE